MTYDAAGLLLTSSVKKTVERLRVFKLKTLNLKARKSLEQETLTAFKGHLNCGGIVVFKTIYLQR